MADDDSSFLDDVAMVEDFLQSFKQNSESGLDLPPPVGELLVEDAVNQEPGTNQSSPLGQFPMENAVNQDPGQYQNSGLVIDLSPLVGQSPVEHAVNQDSGPNQRPDSGPNLPLLVGQQDPGPNQTSEFELDLPSVTLPFQGQSRAPAKNPDSLLTIEVGESEIKFLENFFQENEDQDTLNESDIKFVESLLQEDEDEDGVQGYKPPQDTLNEYIKSLESLLEENENQPTVQVYQFPQDTLNESDSIVLKNQGAECVVKENHPVAEQAQAANSEESDDQAEDEVHPVPVMIRGVYTWEKEKGVAYSLKELASLGVNGIAGRVNCSSCNEAYDMTLPLSRRKLDEFQAFFDGPDKPWERASPLKCTKCGELSASAYVEDNHVNWLFLFLAKQLCNSRHFQILKFFEANCIPWEIGHLKAKDVLYQYERFYQLLLK